MYKKIIILLVLFNLMSFSYAEDIVKIGLDYNKNIDEVVISAENNIYANLEKSKILDFSSNLLKIYKNNKFHLKINQKFDTLEDAIIVRDTIGKNAYLHFNGLWEVYIGNYNTLSEAQKSNNGSYIIVSLDDKNLIVKNANDDIILIYNSNFDISFGSDSVIKYNNTNYRGDFIFKRNMNSDITVINELLIEKYLYGVVSKEMPVSWPIEALKAQAVAARNFTFSNIGKYNNLGFDLTDDINSQVYGGYDAESENTNKAVDDTIGKILKSNDSIVVAYYHSNSGGQTENVENVWQSEVPYLIGVEDEFSENVNNSTWSKSYLVGDISNKLTEAGYNIGDIYDINVLLRSQNNRIIELEFIGSRGSIILEKDKTRKIFGYFDIKSMWFDVVKDNEILYVNNKKYLKEPINKMKIITSDGIKNMDNYSSYNVFDGKNKKEINVKINEFKFDGKGFGHGVGMSQWGANVMANRGYSYEDILLHYYTGTYLDRRN
ncbi:SpoIID/LytB domain-containing protein [Clostridiaceae bacterium HSG29]|nr:SpoIID/LytB domain-containing protein [Clostridiaceae bacterium HSG29]